MSKYLRPCCTLGLFSLSLLVLPGCEVEVDEGPIEDAVEEVEEIGDE